MFIVCNICVNSALQCILQHQKPNTKHNIICTTLAPLVCQLTLTSASHQYYKPQHKMPKTKHHIQRQMYQSILLCATSSPIKYKTRNASLYVVCDDPCQGKEQFSLCVTLVHQFIRQKKSCCVALKSDLFSLSRVNLLKKCLPMRYLWGAEFGTSTNDL